MAIGTCALSEASPSVNCVVPTTSCGCGGGGAGMLNHSSGFHSKLLGAHLSVLHATCGFPTQLLSLRFWGEGSASAENRY